MADSILLIDDDIELLRKLGGYFERRGWDVHRELTGEAGLRTHARTIPDVALVDVHLPDIDGLEVLERLRVSDTAVILLTGDGQAELAVQAMRNGAENFLVKPVDLEHLGAAADRAAEKVRLRRVNRALVGRGAAGESAELVGNSPPMREFRQRLAVLARSTQPAILVAGESGTGKLAVARMIHDLSARAPEPFIEAVAASTESSPLEATIFGVESPDSSAGASRPGLPEIADRGTLALHEITAAPIEVQVRLAAMIERRAFRRSGGTREIPVDVRIVATTSRDPEVEVAEGRFERELQARFKAFSIRVPPLRDLGKADVAAAVQRIVNQVAPRIPGAPATLHDEVLDRLASHHWPGNLREVRHVVERALLQARGEPLVGVEHLPAEFRARPGPFDRRHTPLTMEEVERMHIERTLKHHSGNRTRAAQELGISRATLIAKIKRYAIPH
ncbi:MAG TPA: sigma-54 dependent transcriptional regulator [Gemmatimonadales bacterium]|nr:sigma-54 dependent transcriptional regulator [Gemmatimonadales bacterium]